MAKEKAKLFLEHLLANPDLMSKMKGFTQEELKEGLEELKNEGRITEDDFFLPPAHFREEAELFLAKI